MVRCGAVDYFTDLTHSDRTRLHFVRVFENHVCCKIDLGRKGDESVDHSLLVHVPKESRGASPFEQVASPSRMST